MEGLRTSLAQECRRQVVLEERYEFRRTRRPLLLLSGCTTIWWPTPNEEKERVREVVRDLTNHLIEHDYNLVDHDGTPTRWGVYSPKSLNHDPPWSEERGLKSLSMLSYLAVAEHMTGDPVYGEHVENSSGPRLRHERDDLQDSSRHRFGESVGR